jgi:hypothetical protein
VALLGQAGPRLRWRDEPRHGREASLESSCSRAGAGVSLGLVGSRRVGPILERIGRAYAVRLWLTGAPAPAHEPDALERRLRVESIPGLEVTAAISRQPLAEALAQIDASILLAGGVAVLIAIALAVLIARGLSQPIVELARQTREVMGGQPQAVRGRGGRELVELASTFTGEGILCAELGRRLPELPGHRVSRPDGRAGSALD